MNPNCTCRIRNQTPEDWVGLGPIHDSGCGIFKPRPTSAAPQTMRILLMDCAEKLNLYRSQHSGAYIGGVEYMELQRRIVAALDRLPT